MKKIAFVCLGNICRSPMAEFVMKSLTDQIYIESRATSNWEHGNPIHRGTRNIFKEYGIDYDAEVSSLYTNMHKACQITANDMMLEGNIKKQLTAYIPIISGARMMKDYLKFLFPKQ